MQQFTDFGRQVRVACTIAIIGTANVLGSELVGAQCLLQTIESPSFLSEQMGAAVDYSQNRIILGDPFHGDGEAFEGAAFVYHLAGQVWELEAELIPEIGVGDSSAFGWTVSISGTHIALGSLTAGVHLYTFLNGQWEAAQHIPPQLGNPSFGRNVAIHGTTLLVSAHGESTGGRTGAVYVYENTNGIWEFQTKLTSPLPDLWNTIELFGSRIHFDGQRAVIGEGVGYVYVFERKGPEWYLNSSMYIGNGPSAVAIDGDYAIVGTAGADEFIENGGAVFVLKRAGSKWVQHSVLAPPLPVEGGAFGFTVDLRGDGLAVGARSMNDQDASFVMEQFKRDGDEWLHTGTAVVDTAFPNGTSRSVAIVPGGVVAGSPQAATGGGALIFTDRHAQWTEADTLEPPIPQLNGRFGTSVDAGGDLVVASAPTGSLPPNESAVHVFQQVNGLYLHSHSLSLPDSLGEGEFGELVTTDGKRIAVNAYTTTNRGTSAQPQVAIYSRVDDSWEFAGLAAPDSLASDSWFGLGIVWSGEQLIVGDSRDDELGNNAGAIYVFEESAGAWQLVQKILPPSSGSSQFFGAALAAQDDALFTTNRDFVQVFRRIGGRWAHEEELPAPDVALWWTNPLVITGEMVLAGAPTRARVFVYKRNADLEWSLFQVLQDPLYTDSGFGWSLATDDQHLVVGAPSDDTLCPREISGGPGDGSCYGGAAHMYSLRDGAWHYVSRVMPHEEELNRRFGECVAMAKNVAMISAPIADQPLENSGAVYIFELDEFCPGDIDGDGVVGELDRALLCGLMGAHAGQPTFNPAVDYNNDGVIDHLDLIMFDALTPGSCRADLVHAADFQLPGDGVVNSADLAILLGAWGNGPSCADLASAGNFAATPDGVVDATDLAHLLGSWGNCE
jgi:hypothetical protein